MMPRTRFSLTSRGRTRGIKRGRHQVMPAQAAGTRSRVVYFMETHTRAPQVERLVRVITEGSPTALVLISHDRAGQPLDVPLLESLGNVHVVFDEGGYGDELLRSLDIFIEQNGHWERAAQALYCHRHTLRYRIKRVEQLTGRDFSHARDRIEFWLALRGRELAR